MAAEESTTSPARKVQSILSVAGGVAAETPVRAGVPRNCRQKSAGDAVADAAAAGAGCCADVAAPQATAPSAPFSSFSAARRVIVVRSVGGVRNSEPPGLAMAATRHLRSG